MGTGNSSSTSHNTWCPPRDLIHIHTQTYELNVEFCHHEFCHHEFCYHEAFEAQIKSFHKIRGQHRQHAVPGQTLRQVGNKPESTLTSQPQYRALAIVLWRIVSNAAYI